MTDLRTRTRAAVLRLLERRHGVGARAERMPAWVQLRLDRALDALAVSAGGHLEATCELLQANPAELEQLAEALRVGQTAFYRDPPSWEALRSVLLPRLCNLEWIRAVSAGCSTGEEAWTLAMLIDEALATRSGAGPGQRARRGEPSSRRYRVVGLDRSEVALATARAGVYPADGAEHLPSALRERYLECEAETLRVVDWLRGQVSFVARDVMQGPPAGSYELIVCRNVLIYFGADGGKRAIELLLRSLAVDGVLMVARSEVARVRAMGYHAQELAPGVTVFRA
jgi:chemotaxis methyl-accepting protein methylase